MAFSYNKKNLANTTITGAITPTQTSVTVADATVFSYAFFYATLMPSNEMSNASNSEIVLVTNIQGNTLTLVRGQENTIARSFPYGAVITNGIYTRDIDYARSIGRKVFMARDDGTDDTNTSYQITDPMIKNIPEEGSIITVEFDTPSYGAPTLGVNNGIGGLVQVSGSNIHITDSSGQVDSVGLYGDTQQQTYSGKNLIGLVDGTYTKNSVTAVVKDGVVTFSGTSDATGDMYIPYIKTPLTLAAGTYTHSYSRVPSGSFPMNAGLGYAFNIGWNGTPNTTTINSETSYGNSYRIQIAENNNYNGLVIKPQLESGSSATSFEPYVGGTASPNPDYPQNVNVVTGEQSIEVRGDGKNWFNKDKTPEYRYIDGNGNWATGTYPNVNQEWSVTGSETFTISFSNIVGASAYVRFAEYNADGTFIRRTLVNTTPTTITLNANTRKIIWSVDVSQSYHFDNLQIELGSTATTYEPYKGVTKTVNLGKNLFDKDNANVVHKAPASSGNSLSTGSYYYSVYLPAIEGVTYTFSDSSSSLDQYAKIFFLSENPTTATTFLTQQTRQGGSQSVTATAPSGAKYLCVYLAYTVTQSAIDDLLEKLQIEKGSTATTYAPYFTPIELCKIGTYQDYIYKSGEDWYVRKEIEKKTVSSEDVSRVYNYTNIDYARVAKPITSVNYNNYNEMQYPILCTHASHILTTGSWDKTDRIGKIYASASANDYWIGFVKGTSSDDMKTILNGAMIYYILATPTDTQITNSALTTQLNALYNMLPEGVADVVVTGDLPGSLTIKYYQQGTGTYTAPIVGGAEIDGGDNEQVVELDSYLPYRLVYDTNGYWRVLNKGPKVTTGAIADGAVTPAKLSVDPGKYSTAETIIGSWIDGRPVYRKVLTGTTPEGGATLNHGISNFSRILNVGGWVQSGSFGSQPIQRVVTDALAGYGIGVGDFTSTTFLLQVGSNAAVRGKPYTLILEYIKTV